MISISKNKKKIGESIVVLSNNIGTFSKNGITICRLLSALNNSRMCFSKRKFFEINFETCLKGLNFV